MKMTILSAVLAVLPFCSNAQGAGTEGVILCQGKEDSRLIVELWKPSTFGEPVHCIRADFIDDMTPCAPNGGWGLSEDTPSAELVAITSDWRTAHKHTAGKVTAIAGPRGIRFNAQRGEGVGNNLSYEWKFSLQRLTGAALWYNGDGQKSAYTCEEQS